MGFSDTIAERQVEIRNRRYIAQLVLTLELRRDCGSRKRYNRGNQFRLISTVHQLSSKIDRQIETLLGVLAQRVSKRAL